MAATFTGAASSKITCFVAGTMVLTASGLAAIESVRVGDVVISRNPETMETAPKRVLETYVRGDTKLIHLTIGGEEIVTTETHPFYVNEHGFVNAADLYVGDELVTADNKIVLVEDYRIELTAQPTTVYNFKVEDFHTYFVGNICIWVHNADYANRTPKSGVIRKIENEDGSTAYTKSINGVEVTVIYDKDGYPDFSSYTHPDYPDPVKIDMTGNNYKDFSQANKNIGLSGAKPPKGYTWHHLQDGEHMILVDRSIHDCTIGGFPHTGGCSVVKSK